VAVVVAEVVVVVVASTFTAVVAQIHTIEWHRNNPQELHLLLLLLLLRPRDLLDPPDRLRKILRR
jgi:hypothetical protein